MDIKIVIQQQICMGPPLLMRGFLTIGLHQALENAGCKHPERQMNALQKIIWEEWVRPIWETRNQLMYDHLNRFNAAEERELNARMKWYNANKNDRLAFHDRFLAEIDIAHLAKMRAKTKRR